MNLTALANVCLQPIRDVHGSVSLNSGLRVLELNRAIGSGDGSDHVKGERQISNVTVLVITN